MRHFRSLRLIAFVLLFSLFVVLGEAETKRLDADLDKDELPTLHKSKSFSKVELGEVDALAGASDVVDLTLINGYDDTQGVVGEEMLLQFFSDDFVVVSYTIEGDLPPGLSLSSDVNKFGVGKITGMPSEEGSWLFRLVGWEFKNATGMKSTSLRVFVEVDSLGPSILEQPRNIVANWGEEAVLSVAVSSIEGVTYQWQKDLEDVPGATNSELRFAKTLSARQGVYRVAVSNVKGIVFSEDAFVSVSSTGYQKWVEQVFDDPFSNSARIQADPDKDGLYNIVEYAFGSDPMSRQFVNPWLVSIKTVAGVPCLSIRYPRSESASDVVIMPEWSSHLENAEWNSFEADSITSRDLGSGLIELIIPFEDSLFVRLVVAATSL